MGHCWDDLDCGLITDQDDCEYHGCIWYNGQCHSTLVCEDFATELECWANHCFWYDGACHSVQKEEMPWLAITLVASAGAVVALALAIKKTIKTKA